MDSEFLIGREGWNNEYTSVFEFEHHFDEAILAKEYNFGWSFWRANERDHEQQRQQHQIILLLQNFASDCRFMSYYLVQFWGVVKVEGRHHHLSASNHPFSVGHRLRKGFYWYRNVCRDHEYVVDIEGDKEQQLIGCVGRAYRNKQPESTPDLRLYSTNEFPLRDDAARCGFRGYLALPLFDFDTNKYYGVLELLSDDAIMERALISTLDGALQIAGLRSTHNTLRLSGTMEPDRESEIKNILGFAMKTVPQLYMAQVWVPCKQCASISTNLCCMEIAFVKGPCNRIINLLDERYYNDDVIRGYLVACEYHHLQIDVSSFHSNLCDASLSKNPLAHYAHRARISHCLAISLQSLNSSDQLYHIQFFLHPKPTFREDAYGDYALHLLLRIMDINLKTFKVVSGGQLVEEFLVQSRQPNAIECASVDSLNVMNSYKEDFSESDFTAYLGTADICCLRPLSDYDDAHVPYSGRNVRGHGWVFCLPVGERLCENNINSNPLLVLVPIKEKIKDFMMKISGDLNNEHFWLVQFWTPKMVEGRCYLENVDQPYAVGCLSKGLASFRKKCMSHSYCVDDEAEEEELGPPDVKEFSIRNYAMHCRPRGYLALPIFDDDEHNHKCVGVLEFLGIGLELDDFEDIKSKLKASNLCSTHFGTRFLANEQAVNTIYCRKEALAEVRNALELICDIPQLHKACVWVPNGECVSTINSNMTCLELVLSTDLSLLNSDMWLYKFNVKTVSSSMQASNLCSTHFGTRFLANEQAVNTIDCRKEALNEVRIALYLISCIPQLHMAYVWVPNGECVSTINSNMTCLELVLSTDDLEEFMPTNLTQHVQTRKGMVGMVLASENKSCFCRNLCEFSIVDQPLSHYEMRDRRDVCFVICLQSSHTGDLVYVVEFFLYQGPATYEYVRSFLNFLLPIMKHELKSFKMASGKPLGEELVVEVIEFSEASNLQYSSESEDAEDVFPIKFKSVHYSQKEHQHSEEQQAEKCSVAASDSKTRERVKRKTGLRLSLEALQPHFGKKLKDVAEELGVGRSTIKRACRENGIDRWPSKGKHKRNPSLFERESCRDSQQDTNTESTHHVIAEEEPEKVIIKVKYGEDIIKFELCLSLGLAKLMEEVGTRLSLEMGSFKLKYKDEDGDEILLTRDDDLQLCPKSATSTGRTCVQLMVR